MKVILIISLTKQWRIHGGGVGDRSDSSPPKTSSSSFVLLRIFKLKSDIKHKSILSKFECFHKYMCQLQCLVICEGCFGILRVVGPM